MRLLWLGLIGCLMSVYLYAQVGLDPDKHPRQFKLDTWDHRDGLPGKVIDHLQQTQDGYLWLGTETGLYRFDGRQFQWIQEFEEPQRDIYDLTLDHKGHLWVAFHHSVYVREPNGFRLVAEENAIKAIAVDAEGTLWMATWFGLIRRDSDGTRTFYGEQSPLGVQRCHDILIANNRVLLATSQGLFQIRDEGVEKVASVGIKRLVPGLKNTVWAGTFRKGLMHLRDGKLHADEGGFGSAGELPDAICEDSQGSLWLGAEDLRRFRKGQVDDLAIHNQPGAVTAIFEDQQGRLWVGTRYGTLVRLANGVFTNWVPDDSYPRDEFLGSLSVNDAGKLLFTGTYGIHHLASSRLTSHYIQERGETWMLTSLDRAPDGSYWAGTLGQGAFQLRDGQFIKHTSPGQSAIRQIFWPGDGAQWIVHDQTIVRRHEGKEYRAFTLSDGQRILQAFPRANGSLWIATTKGLASLAANQTIWLIENQWVNHIFSDSTDQTWVLFNGKPALMRAEHPLYVPIAESFNAYGMIEDNQGFLWFSTDDGIFRGQRKALEALAGSEGPPVQMRRFGLNDGMKHDRALPMWQNAAKDARGHLWFAMFGSLVEVNPADIEPPKSPPSPILERVTLNGEPFTYAEGFSIPAGNQRLDWAFNVVDLSSEPVHYRYRLKPLDTEWVDRGTQGQLSFPSLEPGSYSLSLATSKGNGVWREMDTVFHFQKEPLFYQTTAFKIILVLLGALLTALANAFRLRRLKARATELEGLVAERTTGLREAQSQLRDLYEKLQEDNQRKTQELHDARHLQLAMLPEHPPEIPGLHMATYMQTATEVGGDYYDFFTHDDGSVTMAVGDATGHGLKAGLMVVTAKSHFSFHAGDASPQELAQRISQGLKNLKFKSMFMAMLLARYKQGDIEILGAGMPPVLLRKKSGEVQQIAAKGLPLGAMPNFSYQTHTLHMDIGDTLLLMSDGLCERFNPQEEPLGEEPIAARFGKLKDLQGEDLLQALVDLGETWAEGRPADDDIALVVLTRTN